VDSKEEEQEAEAMDVDPEDEAAASSSSSGDNEEHSECKATEMSASAAAASAAPATAPAVGSKRKSVLPSKYKNEPVKGENARGNKMRKTAIGTDTTAAAANLESLSQRSIRSFTSPAHPTNRSALFRQNNSAQGAAAVTPSSTKPSQRAAVASASAARTDVGNSAHLGCLRCPACKGAAEQVR